MEHLWNVIGYGLDSTIEGIASIVIIWRFTGNRIHSDDAETRAQKIVALSFFLLPLHHHRRPTAPAHRQPSTGELGRDRARDRQHRADAAVRPSEETPREPTPVRRHRRRRHPKHPLRLPLARAGLAFSIADLGHLQVTSGLSDLAFAPTVISCFPAAMFVMSGAFGLSRAGIISKRFFSAGVAAVVLVLLGGTTWASDGFWAPDGAYALISQIVLFAWIAVLSGFPAMRPSAAQAPERAAVPAAQFGTAAISLGAIDLRQVGRYAR
jgi:hypothetical protein